LVYSGERRVNNGLGGITKQRGRRFFEEESIDPGHQGLFGIGSLGLVFEKIYEFVDELMSHSAKVRFSEDLNSRVGILSTFVTLAVCCNSSTQPKIESIVNENGKITRQALLLSSCLDDYDKLKSEIDFGSVKNFLKSSAGGSFSDEEIFEFSSNGLSKDEVLTMIDRTDFTFVYFSGHSYFEDRQIVVPLKNNEMISESEFIRHNKKLWIFLDCCRTNETQVNSPSFELPRNMYLLPNDSPERRANWLLKISEMEPFFLIFYVTKLEGFAFSDATGGYGTQLFFNTLAENLGSETAFDFEQFVFQLNQTSRVLQNSSYVTGNLDLKEFSCIFN
jgi:hypothetical protein